MELLITVTLGGTLLGVGMLMHVFKFGLKQILGYDLFVDILLSAILLHTLAGTMMGTLFALFGGLALSVTLYVMRRTIGYKKLEWRKIPYKLFPGAPAIELPQLGWYDYPPVWFARSPQR